MIARVWRGWAAPEGADAYERHFRSSVLTELEGLEGFRGATLLRRASGDEVEEVEVLAITWFESMDAVRRFAGPEPERAVVQEAAHRVLSRYEEAVSHYEVRASTGRG